MVTSLTGITTTGTPHLGNYIGAIRPAIAMSQYSDRSFYFLADWHALIKCQEPELIHQSTITIAATWLACGLNPEKTFFYRQSNIPELSELTWYLTCVTAKGLMNRAHAYKKAAQENIEDKKDADASITMGLFSYPVLMSADILLFQADKVPVGKDQIQHVEMARDIAQRFNHIYNKQVLTLPEAVVDHNSPLLLGQDGKKMSKSYNNTIPLFSTDKVLKKNVNGIKTNLLKPGERKDPDDSVIFNLWNAFATPNETQEMRQKFYDGIGWGDVKKELFSLLKTHLEEYKDDYEYYMSNTKKIEEILQHGEQKARLISVESLQEVKDTIGIRPI